MTPGTDSAPAPRRLVGSVLAQERVSASMRLLAVELEAGTSFLPGQFCMINLEGAGRLALSRPLSILSADDRRLELLYKVVGEGTRALAAARPGEPVRVLTPLGKPFAPPDDDLPRVLLAGGVGLPPLWSWLAAHGRDGDLACFGGRDPEDVPWPLLDDRWRVSVDRVGAGDDARAAFTGTVVDLAESLLSGDASPRHVLSCGPLPLLKAARDLAGRRGWPCAVSVEERMGCGYGVCRGCVVPTVDDRWRTACKEGPVFAAEELDWERLGLPAAAALAAYEAPPACPSSEVKP